MLQTGSVNKQTNKWKTTVHLIDPQMFNGATPIHHQCVNPNWLQLQDIHVTIIRISKLEESLQEHQLGWNYNFEVTIVGTNSKALHKISINPVKFT